MLIIFFVFLVFDSIQPFKHIYSADKENNDYADKNKAHKGHIGSKVAGAYGGPHKAPPAGKKNRMLTQPGSGAQNTPAGPGLAFESSVEDQDTMSSENKEDGPKPYEAPTEDASASLYTTVKPKPYEAPTPESEVSEV